MNILLDYFFPITAINPTASANTGWLKQVLAVVKPKNGGVTPDVITLCTSKSAVAALTNNTDVDKLFDGGLSRVYVLPTNGLDLSAILEGHESDFFTILISSDFSDAEIETIVETPAVKSSVKIQDITYEAVTAGEDGDDITIAYSDTGSGGEATVSVLSDAITVVIEAGVTTAEDIATAVNEHVTAGAMVVATCDVGDEDDPQAAVTATNLEGGVDEVTGSGMDLGDFTGVVGVSSNDDTFLAAQAVIENRCAFHTTVTNKAKNMFYSFGKLLSNSLSWLNQQYVTANVADDVATLGDANDLFDDKISFVISDSEFGNRLALFACGGKAIVAPYITKNLQIDLQSAALTYISGNQPNYTKKAAALLEDELQKVVDLYIQRQWIEAGVVTVALEDDNFVASGYINISEPKALWRIFGEIRQTL